MTSRQQFEARYPIPEGVQWNPESSRYALIEISNARNTGSTIARYEAYVHSWSVWKASREDVVVRLSAEDPAGTGPGDCEGGRPSFEQYCAAECNAIIADCRTAIESAGLRVSP